MENKCKSKPRIQSFCKKSYTHTEINIFTNLDVSSSSSGVYFNNVSEQEIEGIIELQSKLQIHFKS